MLQVDKLSFDRGYSRLLDQLCFRAQAKTVLHIQGPNGSGKTTLLKIIANLLSPSEGRCLWQEQAVHEIADYQQQLHYLADSSALYHQATCLDNIAWMASLLGYNGQLAPILEQLELTHLAARQAGQLSFGQQRRLTWARFLLAPRVLWLLDEPFLGLDSASWDYFQNLVTKHCQAQGLVIMSSHQALPDFSVPKQTVVLSG